MFTRLNKIAVLHLTASLCVVALTALPANADVVSITNPSFEDGFMGWSKSDSLEFYSNVDTSWPTDGSYGLHMWSRTEMTFTLGVYESFYQIVDMTEISAVQFDVQLSAHYDNDLYDFDHFAAVFLVDNVPYWTQTVGGTYMNQSIDVSALSGPHTIELRNECVQAGTYTPSNWTEWDNLRAAQVPEPSTLWLLILGGLSLLALRQQRRTRVA